MDLEIFDFAVFSEIRVVKNAFLRLRKKFLGHIKKITDPYSTHQDLSFEL